MYIHSREAMGQICKRPFELPPISNGQKMALAAALEYEACRKCGVEVTKLELCSKYGISMVRFNNAMGKLNKGESKE